MESNKNAQSNQNQEDIIEEVKETENWADIHEYFTDELWKKQWQNQGFDYQTTESWIKKGLSPYDCYLVAYSRGKGYAPHNINKEQLEKEYKEWEETPKSAQEYLDILYPTNIRDKIEWLNLSSKNLIGELELNDFPNLQGIDISNNQLTKLSLTNCPQLESLWCPSNQLTNLDFLTSLNKKKLEELYIFNNNITSDLTPLSEFINLKTLSLRNNSFFGSLEPLRNLTKLENLEINNNQITGSLAPLKGMSKLRRLIISDTDLNSGLEYLSDNIKNLGCSADGRENAKVKTIKNDWIYCGENVKVYQELIKDTSAQEWLDRNYPLNEVCQREDDKDNYNEKKRDEITSLRIVNQNLKGGLRLTGFTKLERLYCYDNQLTNLDLGYSENLKWLYAENNNLSSLHFLKLVPELEVLGISNNPDLPKDSLKFITELKELESLAIDNCPFEGSLEPLKDLNKLKTLWITNTNLSEGLEHLPENLKEIYCNSDHSHKSIQIVKELEKHLEGKEGGWYYNFPKWLKNKRNSIANSVPLEKLYVIRGNLIRFLNKWGIREDKVSEVSKLQDPKEISTYWYFGESGQWIARASAVTGGIVAATTNPVLGGVLAATSPAIEVFSTQLKERIYEAQEKKWDAYSEDLEDLLNNYHELLGIIETIVIGEKGEVNEALQTLKSRIEDVLTRYDEDKNQMVDMEELKTKKGKAKFAEDLNNKEDNQLQKIIKAIEKVKEEVIKYHRRNEKNEVSTESENQETKLYQQIEKKLKEIREKELVEQQNSLEFKLKKAKINYQQIENRLTKEKEDLCLLKKSKKLTNEEENLLNSRIKKLEQELSETKKEIDNLKKEQYKTWWEKGKNLLFCRSEDKKESSPRENLSLESPEKQKEVQEFIENQEVTVINLEENEQGRLTEKETIKEDPQEQSSTQAQIEIPPK